MVQKYIGYSFLILLLFSGLSQLVTSCTKSYTLTPISSVNIPTSTPTPCNVGMVTTLAGSAGVAGFADATGSAAQFAGPYGLATDSLGNVYVADGRNERIRKITPGGIVTTFAGSGSPGFVNGTGTAASFHSPAGVALDPSGNVYIADEYNNAVREITPGGVVTTLAGSGAAGAINATGTSATFNNPLGIAVDSAGNVYVSDQANNLIRKITSGGVVTTLAGSGVAGSTNGTGTAASFNWPIGIAVDTSGNVYVAEYDNDLIREITPGGVVTTLAGSGSFGSTDGIGTAASFHSPAGVAVDSTGNVYVGDTGNNLIRKITPGGLVTTIAGSGAIGSANGTGSAASFWNPVGMAVYGGCTLFVCDFSNDTIREIQ